MEDKFIWTADLVAEFCEYAGLRIGKNTGIRQQIDLLMADFKASKLPSKEYEILEYEERTPRVAEIKSVKRVSDGEVFKVGDKVAYNMVNASAFIIDHFFIRNDGRMIVRDKGCGMVEEVNNNLVKVNRPLFITEDGVSVTDEEQIVWYVDDRCKLNTRKAKNANGSPKCVKIYSKADAAEEYILLNKPCLSLNDLLGVWDEQASIDLYRNSPLFKNFKELAKSKINQK